MPVFIGKAPRKSSTKIFVLVCRLSQNGPACISIASRALMLAAASFFVSFNSPISSLALCCPKVISSLPTWIVPEGWRIIKSVKVKPNPEFQAFTALVDRVLAVPHSEILRREAEYKRQEIGRAHV